MKIENDLFLLSNTTCNSILAQRICTSINGKMAQLRKKKIKDALFPFFEDLYLKGYLFVFD